MKLFATVFVLAAVTAGGAHALSLHNPIKRPKDDYVRIQLDRTTPDAEVTVSSPTASGVAETEFDNGLAFGAAYGFNLQPRRLRGLQLEAELGRRSANIDRVILGAGDDTPEVYSGNGIDGVPIYTAMANVRYHMNRNAQLQPYLQGGVGAAYFAEGGLTGGENSDSFTTLGFQAAGGVDYKLKNGVSFGVGYSYFRAENTDEGEAGVLDIETKTTYSEYAVSSRVTIPFSSIGARFARRGDSRLDTDRLAAAAEERDRHVEKKGSVLARANPLNWIPERKNEPAPVQYADAAGAMRASASSSSPSAAPSLKPKPMATLRQPAQRTAAAPTETPELRAGVQSPTLASATDARWLRLGDYASVDQARDAWAFKMSAHSDLLRGRTPIYTEVLNRAGATRYELRAGPFASDEANVACALIVGTCAVLTR